MSPIELNNRPMASVAEIASLCGAERRDYMALWKVFSDDTADGRKEQFVGAGIVVGRMPHWRAFHRAWNRECRNAPRIKYFHGKELGGLTKQFAQFRNKNLYPDEQSGWGAARAKKDSLREVILNSDLSTLGYGVRVPIYKEFREKHPRAKRFMGTDAFEFLIQICFTETVKLLQSVDRHAKVAFVGDLDEGKAARYLKVYQSWTKANPTVSERSVGISFLPDERWPGLQSADMVATVVKKLFEETKDVAGKRLTYAELAGKVGETAF